MKTKILVDNILKYLFLFLFFRENKADSSCESSAKQKQMIHMKCRLLSASAETGI